MAASTAARRDRGTVRAAQLYRLAIEAGWEYRFAQARRLLRQAAGLLDRYEAADARLRIRVHVSLAYAEAEAGSLAAGTDELRAAHLLLDTLDEPDGELAGLLHGQEGILAILSGRVLDGLDHLGRAIPLLEGVLEAGGGDASVLATAYLNAGFARLDLGMTVLAAADFRRCADIAGRHALPRHAAKALHNLGYVEYLFGDMPAAIQHFAEAERLFTAVAPSLLSVAKLDQARASLAAGLADAAGRQLDEVLPLLRRQRAGQELAEAEVTRAGAAMLTGDTALALRLARSARRGFARRGNHRWAAIAALAELRVQAGTALRRGRVPAAMPVRAVKLADELRTMLLDDEAALALLLAVRMECVRGELASAELLLEAVPAPRVTTPIDHQMLGRLCRAELAAAQGRTRTAFAEAAVGLRELGRARDRMGGLDLVCGTAVHGQELGDLAIRLVLAARRPNAAGLFGWLERTRAQVYRYEPLPAIDDPEMARQASELRALRRAVQNERAAGRPTKRLVRQADTLEREVLRRGWYATPWGRPRPVAAFADVVAELGERALVSFAVSGDELVAVVVVTGRARLVRLGSAEVAAEWAARLHADLDALAPDRLPAGLVEVVGTSARRSADALDAQLIGPLSAVLGDRELVVVPTGELYAVPWGSLPSLRGRAVVVAPSATAWLAAVDAKPAVGEVLLVRGPGLTSEVTEEASLREVYPSAARLAGTDAVVGAVLSTLDGTGVAHLAAHGEHEPANALFSRLELADGPLFAYEVARLRQPPNQVVLAACELALSYVRPGDEALGYAGALLAGGVATVVAAVSRVGDSAAASAMIDYHRALARGVRPAVALAEAVAVDPFRRPFVCLGAG